MDEALLPAVGLGMVTPLTVADHDTWIKERKKRLAERRAMNRMLEFLIAVQIVTIVLMVMGIILRVYGHS